MCICRIIVALTMSEYEEVAAKAAAQRLSHDRASRYQGIRGRHCLHSTEGTRVHSNIKGSSLTGLRTPSVHLKRLSYSQTRQQAPGQLLSGQWNGMAHLCQVALAGTAGPVLRRRAWLGVRWRRLGRLTPV